MPADGLTKDEGTAADKLRLIRKATCHTFDEDVMMKAKEEERHRRQMRGKLRAATNNLAELERPGRKDKWGSLNLPFSRQDVDTKREIMEKIQSMGKGN